MTATESDRAPMNESVPVRGRIATAAVVLALGRADREAFAPCWATVLGRPTVAWSVDVLDACAAIGDVAFVVSEDRLATAYALVATAGWRKVRIVAAPPALAPSLHLLAGIEALGQAHGTLVLQDGADLLSAPDLLAAALLRAGDGQVVTVATPVKETLKWVDARGDVRRTPSRASLWRCQTPAIFPRREVERSLRGPAAADIAARSQRGGIAWLLNACAGCPVRIVRAGYDEVQVRTPEDLAPAEALLRARAGR